MSESIQKHHVMNILNARIYNQRNWGGPANLEIARKLKAVKDDILGLVPSVSIINDLVNAAHQNAIDKGWWEEPRTFPELIALMHSELSEALEDYRNGRKTTEVWYEKKAADSDHGPGTWIENSQISPDWKPCGIPSELADVVIRIFDTCGYFGIDLEQAIREKMAFNATRPQRHGGKKL